MTAEKKTKNADLTYDVSEVSEGIKLDANWDKLVWQGIKPLQINQYMGDAPAHRPKVQAKLARKDDTLYVIFKVEDHYVRSVATETHGNVWEDSCVEFFFTPDSEHSEKYFNIEINCGGVVLFHYQTVDGPKTPIAVEDCKKLEIAHTMPKTVNPEIQKPRTWFIEYKLPFEIVQKHFPGAKKPSEGGSWKANFYKCADKTSQPHWLTWSYIDNPTPKFHVPSNFGTIEFE